MEDIFKSAVKVQKELPLEIMAHKVSAEYHRHMNMSLGGISIVLTTFVSTAIFTGLVSQLGLDGKGDLRNPFADEGMDLLYIIAILLSVSAPIMSALHTFKHHAEDAATHLNSVAGYNDVLRLLTVYLSKYDNSTPLEQKRDEALKEYDEIMKKYNEVVGRSITLTKKAYKEAAKKLSMEVRPNHKTLSSVQTNS
jgi:hypothetical protein